jgi:predicted O-methyltransferase YrrM
MLNENFNGIQYRLADNWYDHMNINKYAHKPINYLEIGTLCGANLLSVAKTYGLHPDSKLHCIDPWEDYDEYPEFKNEQDSLYSMFIKNVSSFGQKDKIIVHRGYSNNEVLKFDNEIFDIIYIDGNHQPEYVLEDGVLCFRKLKKGGIMIFDDYGWGGPDLTQRGIDAFLSGYRDRIQYLGMRCTQVFIMKT